MKATLGIAIAEFRRSFGLRSGAPGGRDFIWLSIFFCLSTFLLFLGLAATDGARHRFEQVLLGALPASNPPIRLDTHTDRPEGLTFDLLTAFDTEFPGVEKVPTRTFDGQSGVLQVPGFEAADDAPKGAIGGGLCQQRAEKRVAWRCNENGDYAEFLGMAMPRNAPLWRWIDGLDRSRANAAPDGFVVALSRTLFRKHFNVKRYREAVIGNLRVPCPIRQDLYATPEDRELTSLVLRLREGEQRGEAYHVARIIWVDSFPIDRVAMVIPLTDYEILMAAEGHEDRFLLTPEAPRGAPRISGIKFDEIDSIKPEAERVRTVAAIRKFASCLGAIQPDQPVVPSTASELSCVPPPAKAEASLPKGEAPSAQVLVPAEANEQPILPRLQMQDDFAVVRATPVWPLRREHLRACAAKAGLDPRLADGPVAATARTPSIDLDFAPSATPVVWSAFAQLKVPCAALAHSGKAEGTCDKTLPGYENAFAYVGAGKNSAAARRGERSILQELVDRLVNWKPDKRFVFRLDPAYEGALVRFGVLSTMLDLVSTPIGVGMIVTYLFLTGIIMATIFSHRRAQYGLLMMNGMSNLGVTALVLSQVVFSSILGLSWGLLFMLAARVYLNTELSGAAIVQQAQKIIGLDVREFVAEPSITLHGTAWLAMLAASLVVTVVVLWCQRISTAKGPIFLLKG